MKSIRILALLLIPILAICQDSGISFVHQLSWRDILEKARAENKYIFVDCFATWCAPCKEMEKTVFTSENVGRYMNGNFIAVKLQMDSAKNDDPYVKIMYSTARYISARYKIGSYPTYLFFSPDGVAVHKGVGVWSDSDFLRISRAALDTNQQYYFLLQRFNKRNDGYNYMPALARMGKQIGEDSVAQSVTEYYIENYLNQLPEESLYNRENLGFVAEFQDFLTSKDRIFWLCLDKGLIVDSVMGMKGLSVSIANHVIYNEVLANISETKKIGHEPNWEKISNRMKTKYGDQFVGGNMDRAKIEYYRAMKQWKKYIDLFAENMRITDISKVPSNEWNMMALNNQAFEVFKYSDKKEDLKMAIAWVDRALTFDSIPSPRIASVIDTKANLLYKMGQKSKGINLEERAIKISPQGQEFKSTLEKMRKGIPTWPMN